MTREEAIMELNQFGGTTQLKLSANFWTALNMAIKTLEQQPSDDCVSRTDVIKVLNNHWLSGSCSRRIIDEQIDKVKALPPVTPTQRWIPVSERLPEEDKDYLLFGKVVEDEENNIFIGEYDSCGEQFGVWIEQFDRTTLGCLGSEFYEYASVLAWMPLPEPYKAEMEVEE